MQKAQGSHITKDKKESSKKEKDKKVVLYAPTFSKKLTSLEDCFDTIKHLIETRDWHWLIKFHPLTDIHWVKQYKSLLGNNVEFVESQSILPLLKAADVLLSDTSSVIGEFSLLEKPVVTLNNSEPEPHLFNVSRAELIEGALNSALQLNADSLNKIKKSNAASHPYNDGHSSRRVLDSIDNIIENNIKPPKKRPMNLFRNYELRKKLSYWRPF